MPDVVMPRLSDATREGTVLRWLRTDGDAVVAGDEVAEVEAETATVTVAAPAAGVLRVSAATGAVLPVGAALARIEAPDGDEAVASARAPVAAPLTGEVTATGTKKGDVTTIEPTRPQQVVARRIAESKAVVPHVTFTTEVDATALVAAGGSFAALVVRAVALALREVPRANAAYRDARFELYSRVNVGVAVEAQGALVVPTIHDADVRAVDVIAAELRDLADRARRGVSTAAELAGATFTVTGLEARAVTATIPVIVPPQAGILGVGAVRDEPVVRDGAVVPGKRLTLTLAADHRILYGEDADRFLCAVRDGLQAPERLLGG